MNIELLAAVPGEDLSGLGSQNTMLLVWSVRNLTLCSAGLAIVYSICICKLLIETGSELLAHCPSFVGSKVSQIATLWLLIVLELFLSIIRTHIIHGPRVVDRSEETITHASLRILVGIGTQQLVLVGVCRVGTTSGFDIFAHKVMQIGIKFDLLVCTIVVLYLSLVGIIALIR